MTNADVATPVVAQAGNVGPGCGPSSNGHRFCGWPELKVEVIFRARVAANNVTSYYRIDEQFTSTGKCSLGCLTAQTARTKTDLHAGQLVRMSTPVVACPGVIHGAVVYDSRQNRGYRRERLPGMPGYSDGVPVGTFHFDVP